MTEPLSATILVAALAITFAAGVLKGAVGFGLPTVMIAGLSLLVAPDVALAALVFPTLLSNGLQAMRGGRAAALAALRRFAPFLVAGFVLMILSAQAVPWMSARLMLLLIGIPVSLVAGFALMGRTLPIPTPPTARIQAVVGAVAGFFGGITGIWGPPTVALLTAMHTPKVEQIRIQGVVYGLGALTLVASHTVSGVLDARSAVASLLLCVPALAGLHVGFRVQDRLDQRRFERVTHVVLLLAGGFLILRGLAAG
ncbi:sulfite exporter TauE/SafE family protein [Roseovarius sp. SCSIO 43702]|uniref:sulfite exporter TauE/SafE family protein n=1 Tax=Roseovarius sp. SCSIO 43702 TaxID=2823043 RepID=UPI002175DFF7|nr:sulfite exporter TauE/SafE family protein [Roseovarius sp. SCSIO 43702]